jgi:Phage integrase family
VEVLRHTGIRVEELSELSHHSLVQYRLPATGELVPLLQIAPSKTDAERLLVISPELADVLSAIVSRVRHGEAALPLVVSYDIHERVWNPPMPLLFQHRHGVENRPITVHTVRALLNRTLTATGLKDASGQPLTYTPHDFRRIFITDAILNGMPPHIAQLVAGHKAITTTMGYKAVYPEEVITGHRAFIARRRATRPSEEYRSPTDEEWEEFLGHFERRRVALGDCGRAYGTSCIHEHSCVRCPLLRVEPAQRPRLADIRDNLTARIDEAQREGWTGEAEGLQVSLAAASAKLAQADELIARRKAAVSLGMPAFHDIAGRTATPAKDPA